MDLSESKRKTRDARAVHLAERLLAGTFGWLEGCRELSGLLRDEHRHDEPYVTVIVFESDTDHIPLPQERHLYAAEYLSRVDQELRESLMIYKEGLRAACIAIIKTNAADTRENGKE